MSELHLPWLEMLVLVPLLGAAVVDRLRDVNRARWASMLFTGVALLCAAGTWADFVLSHAVEADDPGHLFSRVLGREVLVIDQLSAPLLFLVALLYFLTTLSTLRTKIRRFSFAWMLVSEALALATFSCQEAWGVIGLMTAATVPPWLELRARGKPTRVYVLHAALFAALMIAGQAGVEWEGSGEAHSLWFVGLLLAAVLVRSGIVPFHCWMTDLFEHATFGTALLFVTPIGGAYAAIRLVLPVAPDWVLHGIGLASLATAVYAAAMSLVQRDARRFCCFLCLCHSALVLVGLEMVTPIGLTGALCIWLSVGLALGGFGMTLRALEARCGRLSLENFQGLYSHTPNLAMCFGITGLAAVGFPGTFGFVGTELLVDGAVEAYPLVGVAVVVAAALSGIAVVHAYFKLFTGTQYASSVSLMIRVRERYSVLLLAALILIGGLAPQPWVASRFAAAEELLKQRAAMTGIGSPPAAETDRDETIKTARN